MDQETIVKRILETIEKDLGKKNRCVLDEPFAESVGLTKAELFSHCQQILDHKMAKGFCTRAGCHFMSLQWEGRKFLEESRKSRFRKFLDRNYNGSFLCFVLSFLKLR